MIIDTFIILPGVFLAITLHEFAHGFVAYINGDDTAKNCGRLTINPLKHLDPIGFLMLIVFKFGWAKPVPINENKFKNRRLGLFTVSLAGITMNLIISILSLVLLNIMLKNRFSNELTIDILYSTAQINISFAAFNLLPIPPLDGSKVIYSLIPLKMRFLFYKYESYGMFILLLLSFTGMIYYFLSPIKDVMYLIVNTVLNILL